MFVQLRDGTVINSDHIIIIKKGSVASLRTIWLSGDHSYEVPKEEAEIINGILASINLYAARLPQGDEQCS